MRRTVADQRLAHAHAAISRVQRQPFAADYRRQALDLPALVQRNGLGQALTFLQVRRENNDEVQATLNGLTDWLVQKRRLLPAGDILQGYIGATFVAARRAEYEAIAWATIHKSVAEALLPK